MLKRTIGLILVLPTIVSVVTAQDNHVSVELFSSPEYRVIEVGEDVDFLVEGVASAADDDLASEFISAVRRLAFPGSLADGFEVRHIDPPQISRRAGTSIYQFSKRFVLRFQGEGAFEIPILALSVGHKEFTTRPHLVRAYRSSEALAEAQRSVVPILADVSLGNRQVQRAGSAFLMADDMLVTAYHVIVGADRVHATLPNGRKISTRQAWAIDPIRDVAVLFVNPEHIRDAGLTPLDLADEFHRPVRNDAHGVVFTTGWREGLQVLSAGMRYQSLEFPGSDVLRVSANGVRPGDSGGPLLNSEGEVLGVVSSGRSWTSDPDVLSAELCLAADPRRALAHFAAMDRPASLNTLLRDAAGSAPNADVLHVASLLTVSERFRENPQTGMERLRNAMNSAPDDASLQFLAGSVLQELGNRELASSAYQAALDGLTEYFPALYALGHLHYQEGDLNEAEALFLRTRQFAPYAPLGALGLARVYTARAQYQLAQDMVRDVLGYDASFAPALYLLGYGYIAMDQRQEAEAIAARLDHIDTGWADALRLQLNTPIIAPAALRPIPRVAVASNTSISR